MPVILMTANNDGDLLAEIQTLKLAGLLTKPVPADKLIERVQRFFAKRAA